MVPESVAALYSFFAFVAPGLVYQLLRERDRPALKESAFREASRVALTSTLYTTLSVIALLGVRSSQPGWLADPTEWLAHGRAYAVANAGLVLRTSIVVVVLASVFAYLGHVLSERWRRDPDVVRTDVWYQMFKEDVPKGTVPWVVVKMSDGTVVWGHVDFFTVGEPVGNREISLKGPKLSIRGAADDEPKTEMYWQRISLRAAEISVLKVAYEPKTPKQRRWPIGAGSTIDPVS